MAIPSSTRRGKPARLLKKGTATTKSHRFEPFSQRVVKLKIDPIHRSRRTPQDDDNADTTSYFRSSLEHWIDMNLSENFTRFAGAVNPLCESLPQILYYEDRIMTLLVEYIENRDELCMEPLLDLVAQLARDLGQRFEKHFASTVTLVANVAATHPSIEVIEWSFTCLAWIFKFLSRLLVPDLRQLLGIMSPYLGKEKQKHFVTRFAAESMSFLIRKAALVYYKNQAPLDRALTFLIDDLSNVQGAQQAAAYQDGLMSMLSESIKGVKFGLYSNGADIMRALISAVMETKQVSSDAARQVLEGVLINIIHNTTSDTFSPILDIICETNEGDDHPPSFKVFEVQSRMLFIAVVTRKGSRIQDWKRVHASSLSLLEKCLNSLSSCPALIPVILSIVANAMQTSPMDELLSYMRPLMAKVSDPSLSAFFLSFCSLFADLGLERFQSLVLPYFQKFLSSFWQTYEQDLCLTLPILVNSSAVSFEPNKKGSISVPAAWVTHMGEKLANQAPSTAEIPMLHAYTQIHYGKLVSGDSAAIVESLHTLVKASLEPSGSLIQEHAEFGRGSGFLLYCEMASQTKSVDSGLWNLIETYGVSYTDRPAFLKAILEYIRVCPPGLASIEDRLDSLVSNLLCNLSSPSHELRILSLELIRTFALWVGLNDETCISTAIDIEGSELTLETERHLNMQLRKLAIGYKEFSTKKWLDRLLPNFCFGVLSKRLGTLVDTACDVMKTICDIKAGEDFVSELAVRFFTESGASHSHNPEEEEEEEEDEEPEHRSYSEYECFNVAAIERKVVRIFTPASDPLKRLFRSFASAHAIADLVPVSSRSKALKVLNAVPHVAEKRFRQIVPHFLSWATKDDEFIEPVLGDNAAVVDSEKTTMNICNQYDRKAMLSVFGKFVNPRVLYKASEVHSALMTLLANGDSEMQKLALKALFTWKSPSIHPYEENLLNILDEKRLKDELTIFAHVDEESTTIETEHRPELIPVLFRLLYGRIVSRSGSRTNRGTQEGRRKMILRTLSQLPDFEQFVDIAYGVLSDVPVIQNGAETSGVFDQELVGARKQFGLLKMIETMLDILGVRMLPLTEKTMNVVLYCLVRACRQIGAGNAEHTESLLRSIRQTGIHCLDLLFYISPHIDWSRHVSIIYREVIKPRLHNFAIETAQGVSALLQLFKTWSLRPSSVLYYLEGDQSVIVELVNILAVESARDEVKSFVMEQIISNVLDFSSGRKPKHMKPDEVLDSFLVQRIRDEVLAPHVEPLLIQLEYLLRSQLRRQMTLPAIDTLSRLAPFVQSSSETTKLVRTATYLLQQPADRVPPKAKSGILGVLQHFLPLYDPSDNDSLNKTIFETITSLFDYFKDEPNRKTVSLVFTAFAEHDQSLQEVALLCESLNSLSERKLESVDYEKRLSAFRVVNEEGYLRFDARQWRPLLYNFLYHVKDEDELAIRSSASFGLRRFVERSVPANCQNDPDFANLFETVLLPALRNGAKSSSEIVRVEFVQNMGYAVSLHTEQITINDMQGLLAGGDEEASLFTNILHIQQHRRTRALRRLASESTKGLLRASNIATFFLPLIEHFVFDQADDENAHNLAAEAVSAIGQLCAGLEWSQFRAIYRRYRSYVQTKVGLEKNVLRLLGRMTDSLSDAMQSQVNADMVDGDDRMDIDNQTPGRNTLSTSLPSSDKVRTELKSNFIPFLTKFTHLKDESEVNLRLPAAVIAVKLLKLLSEEDAETLLPPVLLDISNVLRSRSQEARDIARKTLSEIALILGPSYFGHILKELRSTLQRGYQLHVLSYTVHSILVSTSDHFKPGDLDNDLELMADIIVEDIFGTVGQEKEAEEYVSKMKEVKSSKSYDSMELLAKNASIRRLAALIRPIQMLLQEKLTSRIVLKVDELLRRIGIGLIRNPGAETRDTLVFSYEIIKEANQKDETPVVSEIEDREQKRRARFLINLRAARNNPNKGATTAYTHKLARFGLDILRAVLNKFGSLLIVDNIVGFLPVINDALIQAHEEVKLSAMRVLSVVIKLPMVELDQNSEVYLVEAIKMIRESPSTNTEAAQVALKFIATIIRERKATKLKDSHLAYLIKRISADIDDPDRQGIAFNFIRAVMSRRFMVPELYQIVDSIAAMMVTNQTRSARDLARGVYVHFTLEYPQAKSRWNKQLAFLAKNMDYKHTEGRQSVMEAVHMLLSKIGGELAQDMVGCFFLPLVMVMTNDESPECREMAGTLLKEVLERADAEQLKSIMTPLHSWLDQVENPVITETGLQTFRLFFESDRFNKEKELPFVLKLLPRIIRSAEDKEKGSWEVLYYALQLFVKLCQMFPKRTLTPECASIWARVVDSAFYPHTWIRTCAANLIGIWFADEARANAAKGYAAVPLISSSGLELESSIMMTVLRASFVCLRSPTVTEELATQLVRNLVFLGRCFAQNNLDYSAWKIENVNEDEESDEDDIADDRAITAEDLTSGANGEKRKSAIQYIFERVTGVLRREIISTRADALIAKTACMKLIAALCSQLDAAQIRPSLQTILLPLIHLTDPSIPAPHSLDEGFRESYKALVSNCQEILDLLQKKFGTTEFVAEMTTAKERVVKRRDERRVKRKIEAIADPVKFGAEKRRKHDRKREKRKEKGHGFQNRRRGW